MIIPDQLKLDDIRFIKIIKNSKRPAEKDWVNTNYTYNEIEKYNDNYGVLGGVGNLIIIDSDTQELQDKVNKDLPKTFRVKTGGGGCHDYYFCKDLNKKLVLIKDGKHYGEVQSFGSQVVGPNSIHPNGNSYVVEYDIPIQTIDLSVLIKAIKPFTNEFNKKVEWIKTENQFESEYDINNIEMQTIIGDGTKFEKQHNGEYLGPNPWHGSTTGMNFCINPMKNVGYCFRCNVGINPAQAIALKEKVIQNCSDNMTKPQFMETIKIAQEKYGLKKKPIIDTYKNIREEVFSLLLNRKRNEATEIIARNIMDTKHIYTTFNDTKSEVWMYLNGIYIPEGKTRISELCRKILKELHTASLVNEVIKKIEDDTRIIEQEFFDSAIKNVEEIPILDGIFNLIEKKVYPFNPKKIFFNKIPIHYDPEAKCPNIEQHLKDVLKSEDDIQVMYELFGYLLWKKHFIEKGVMMVGDGRNGKSKTIDLMKRFIGVQNCCNVPLEILRGDTFRLSELFGKMANLAGDLSNTVLKDTGMFKSITGRDILGANRKFKSSIYFTNYAKQIFACNELPRVYDATRGFWSRWILFEFPYVFLNEEEYKTSKLANKKIMNTEQIEKISTPSELSGLFNKAIEKLDILLKNRDFSDSIGTDELKKYWRRNSDSFAGFSEDNITEKLDGFILVKDLRKAYKNYCKINKLRPVSKQSITNTLENEFGANLTRKRIISEELEYLWEGIVLKEMPKQLTLFK